MPNEELYKRRFVLQLLKYSFDNKDIVSSLTNSELLKEIDWWECYNFFSEHSILPLCSNLIPFIPDDYSNIKKSWKESVYINLIHYSKIVKQQEIILTELNNKLIPSAVIKGTSAAKYYSKPQLRTMGDVDLLVKPSGYERAVWCLTEFGCHEITSQADADRGRHKSFLYDDVEIELHAFFSSKGMDEDEAKALDEMLFNAILDNDTVLPDDENGLVLLSHIRQHLEGGIGLRQIIDWFMFVKAYLDDDVWLSSFQEKVRIIGLEKLAITVTKMCQTYLGLSTENITWCKDADEKICDDLMECVLECGNFGKSRDMLQSIYAEELPSLKYPIQIFKYIQAHGENNWIILA